MPPKTERSHGGTDVFDFKVDEGMELLTGSPEWDRMELAVGGIVECCLQGSSAGLGGGAEEWAAVLVNEGAGSREQGFSIRGIFLGAEGDGFRAELDASLQLVAAFICAHQTHVLLASKTSYM